MEVDLKVVPGDPIREEARESSPEDLHRHFRNVTRSLLESALGTWSELYGELEGKVSHGLMVRPEARKGFVPEMGWPEFMEKMWLLEHCLDQARRLCEGKA